jgi:hypothetical protein
MYRIGRLRKFVYTIGKKKFMVYKSNMTSHDKETKNQYHNKNYERKLDEAKS